MPVTTIKMSQFSGANINNSTNQLVGVSSTSGGINIQTPIQNLWSTATRPATPYAGLNGFNNTTGLWEYWNGSSWVGVNGSGGGTVNAGSQYDLVYYPNAGTSVSPITGAANSVLVTNSSKVPSLGTILPSGLTIPGYVTQNAWASYTPTISFTGGSGNVPPTFSTQNARWVQVGKVVHVCIDFENPTGGTPGAGTGIINISLPVNIGASSSPGTVGPAGAITGAAATYVCYALLNSSNASNFTLSYLNGTTATQVTGATFANATRYLQMSFFYEV